MTRKLAAHLQRRRDDSSADGFTLIELLISIAISVLLMSALVTVFIAMMGANSVTAARVGDAAGGQQLDATLPGDLESTFPDQIVTSSAASGCATSAGTNVVKLTWSQSLPGPTVITFIASYRLIADTTTNKPSSELVRYYCSGTDQSIRLIARGLAPATASTPGATANVTNGVITVTTTSLQGVHYKYVVAPYTSSSGGTGNPPPTTPPSPTAPPQPPAVSSLTMLDNNHDGWVDEVDVGVTQPLTSSEQSNCLSGSAWTEANWPTQGDTEGIITASGNTVTIPILPNISQPQNTAPTDARGNPFTVTFSPPSNCDILGFSGASPSDDAAPAVTKIVSSDGDGKMEKNDSLTLTFSEALASLSTNTGTVTEKSDGTLTVSGITNGAVPTGGAYVSGSGFSPSFPASYAISGGNGNILTIALSNNNNACSPTTDCAHLQTSSGALALAFASQVQDSSQNKAAPYTTAPTFKLF